MRNQFGEIINPNAEPALAPVSLLCLSVRQPWAWLIVNGWKNVENREWPTSVRGRILIHAGKTMTKDDWYACFDFVRWFAPTVADAIPRPIELQRGGIVGEAVILDCVRGHSSEWFCGPWGFVLADQKPLPFEPVKGALGFFKVERHNKCLDCLTGAFKGAQGYNKLAFPIVD